MKIDHSFSNHQLRDVCNCFYFLVIMNNTAINIHVQVVVWIFSFLGVTQVGEELLDYVRTLCLAV